MAVQTLVEQHIIFIVPESNIDQSGIFANALIQSFALNCAGSDVITSIRSFSNWNGTAFTTHNFFDISGFISTAFQATVQANIPALQAAFPTYTIVTWGYSVQFGN